MPGSCYAMLRRAHHTAAMTRLCVVMGYKAQELPFWQYFQLEKLLSNVWLSTRWPSDLGTR